MDAISNRLSSENSCQQEADYKVGLGETPRRLIRKRCQYSSLEKFEYAFGAAVHLSKVISPFQHFGPVLGTFL